MKISAVLACSVAVLAAAGMAHGAEGPEAEIGRAQV